MSNNKLKISSLGFMFDCGAIAMRASLRCTFKMANCGVFVCSNGTGTGIAIPFNWPNDFRVLDRSSATPSNSILMRETISICFLRNARARARAHFVSVCYSFLLARLAIRLRCVNVHTFEFTQFSVLLRTFFSSASRVLLAAASPSHAPCIKLNGT